MQKYISIGSIGNYLIESKEKYLHVVCVVRLLTMLNVTETRWCEASRQMHFYKFVLALHIMIRQISKSPNFHYIIKLSYGGIHERLTAT